VDNGLDLGEEFFDIDLLFDLMIDYIFQEDNTVFDILIDLIQLNKILNIDQHIQFISKFFKL
jgi:hypothetical protein